MTGGTFAASLKVIPTPIGNLGDITERARRELSAATLLCCEDTRRTGSLLSLLGIDRPKMIVADSHRERAVVEAVLGAMAAGGRVALVTDAGTPGVSDPGSVLVRAVIDAGGEVEVLPGPVAAICGLVASGLDTSRFVVEGFLPRRGPERAQRLDAVARHDMTAVLYEAPHRLARTLEDLESHCGGDRPVALAREMTKLHEEIWRGTLGGARRWIVDQPPRGEFVVVLAAAPRIDVSDADVLAALRAEIEGGARRSDAASVVAEQLGVRRRRAYDLSLEME